MSLLKKLCFRKRSRLSKQILWCLVIFAVSGAVFQGSVGYGEKAYADTSTQSVQVQTQSSTDAIWSIWVIDIFDLILKVLYIILWPLIVVAGWALDNTLVYWSFFHLDAPLWKFWNMMKNFANFILVGVVLWSIIKSVIGGKAASEAMGIIKKTLIAAVLIQASWFLTAALIDLSTIATYAVWALPLSVMQNTNLGDKKILDVHSKLDLSQFSNITTQGDYYKVRYETTDKSTKKQVYLSECKVQSGYIIWRTDGDPKFLNAGIFSSTSGSTLNACVLYGNQVVLFNELNDPSWLEDLSDSVDYQDYIDSVIVNNPFRSDWKTLEACGFIVRVQWVSANLWPCNLTTLNSTAADYYSGNSQYDNVDYLSTPPETTLSALGLSGWTIRFQNDADAITLSSLVDRSKGFVGPLVTIYSSLLNFAQITDTPVLTLWAVSAEMIIKVAFAVMLFFPLLAFAVVLIVRIGYLWLVIAASPLLVLKETFSDLLGKVWWEKINVKSIIPLVFSPVITVFALSIWLIFITTLMQNYDGAEKNLNIQQIATTNGGDQAFDIWWTSFEFSNLSRSGAKDWIYWLILNFMAIGFMRSLLFAAMRANTLTKWISDGIEKFGSNLMGSYPIIPLPGWWGKVWVASAVSEALAAPTRALDTKMSEQHETAMTAYSKIGEKSTGTTPWTVSSTDNKAIANALVNWSTIDVETLTKEEKTPTTTKDYFTSSTNLAELYTAIEWLDTGVKATALTHATTVFESQFNTKLKAGGYSSADEIASILNTNAITQAHAKTLKDTTLTWTGTDKAEHKYTVAFDDTKTPPVTVTETTTAAVASDWKENKITVPPVDATKKSN